jgi:hypothetical protein
MNEPKHPHFVLSDATYCHVLADRLVIAKRDLPSSLPEPGGRPLWFELIGLSLCAAIMAFFFVMAVLAKMYLLAALLLALGCFSAISAARMIGFTDSKAILRSDILSVTYHRRRIGNDFFIVIYATSKGKVARRRLMIYDSEQCLQQALTVMMTEGLFKIASH